MVVATLVCKFENLSVPENRLKIRFKAANQEFKSSREKRLLHNWCMWLFPLYKRKKKKHRKKWFERNTESRISVFSPPSWDGRLCAWTLCGFLIFHLLRTENYPVAKMPCPVSVCNNCFGRCESELIHSVRTLWFRCNSSLVYSFYAVLYNSKQESSIEYMHVFTTYPLIKMHQFTNTSSEHGICNECVWVSVQLALKPSGSYWLSEVYSNNKNSDTIKHR